MFAESECISDRLVPHALRNEADDVMFARRKQSLSVRIRNLKWFQIRNKFEEKL